MHCHSIKASTLYLGSKYMNSCMCIYYIHSNNSYKLKNWIVSSLNTFLSNKRSYGNFYMKISYASLGWQGVSLKVLTF